MYKTFNGWRLDGRVVAAGETGIARNEYGDYLFHKSQTLPKNSRTVTTTYDNKGRKTTRIIEFI